MFILYKIIIINLTKGVLGLCFRFDAMWMGTNRNSRQKWGAIKKNEQALHGWRPRAILSDWLSSDLNTSQREIIMIRAHRNYNCIPAYKHTSEKWLANWLSTLMISLARYNAYLAAKKTSYLTLQQKCTKKKNKHLVSHLSWSDTQCIQSVC